MIDLSREYTSNGEPVQVVFPTHASAEADYPLIGIRIDKDGQPTLHTHTADGYVVDKDHPSKYDLKVVSITEIKWVNIYKSEFGKLSPGPTLYLNEESATVNATKIGINGKVYHGSFPLEFQV